MVPVQVRCANGPFARFTRDQVLFSERGAPTPGSIRNGPDADGATGKSNIAVGRYTVEQEFGMSTTPDSRPSIGAAPSKR